jgi:hypothetical protein
MGIVAQHVFAFIVTVGDLAIFITAGLVIALSGFIVVRQPSAVKEEGVWIVPASAAVAGAVALFHWSPLSEYNAVTSISTGMLRTLVPYYGAIGTLLGVAAYVSGFVLIQRKSDVRGVRLGDYLLVSSFMMPISWPMLVPLTWKVKNQDPAKSSIP